jgi:hypothetical protein
MTTIKLIRLLPLAASLLFVASCGRGGHDASPASAAANHTSFESATAAVDALVTALKSGTADDLGKILGPGSEELLSSGDPVADATDREAFVARYEAKHALVPQDDGSQLLQIGEDDWPFPVPITQRDGRWYFDGAAGADEVIFRRVGRNELGAIAVCHGFVDAQTEYAATGHDGQMAGLYAPFLISDEGEHNGLYWPTAAGEDPSPAGEFVAAAAAQGYRKSGSGEPTPYHGYYYRMLYAQGANAPGGKKDYFVDGRLVDGYALIAWPADYGVSGVKTFLVNQEGTVYEKDLGEDTASAITMIEEFDPDSSWSPVVEPAT